MCIYIYSIITWLELDLIQKIKNISLCEYYRNSNFEFWMSMYWKTWKLTTRLWKTKNRLNGNPLFHFCNTNYPFIFVYDQVRFQGLKIWKVHWLRKPFPPSECGSTFFKPIGHWGGVCMDSYVFSKFVNLQ